MSFHLKSNFVDINKAYNVIIENNIVDATDQHQFVFGSLLTYCDEGYPDNILRVQNNTFHGVSEFNSRNLIFLSGFVKMSVLDNLFIDFSY